MNSIRSQSFDSLHMLRGIAATWMILFHIQWQYPAWGWPIVRNGYLLVDVFFVLSGFVICHGYQNRLHNNQQLLSFFWLRFFRLWPLHLLMLL